MIRQATLRRCAWSLERRHRHLDSWLAQFEAEITGERICWASITIDVPQVRSSAYGRGAGVGRGLGVGRRPGVGVGLGVDVGLGVGVEVGVAVGVGVGVPAGP